MEKGKIGVAVIIIVAIITLVIGVGIGFAVTTIIRNNESKTIGQNQNTTGNELTKNVIENNVNTTTVQNQTISSTQNTVNETISTQTTTLERKLSEAELDLFENYFNTPTIWNFLLPVYSDISEFSLSYFLRWYFYNDVTASEKEAKEITGQEYVAVPIHLYSKEIIDNTFKKYTGKDVSILKEENMPKYYEKLDRYYNGTSDYETMTIDVISGTELNGKFVIRYNGTKVGKTKTYEVTLNRVNGQYLFISNVEI